MIAVMRRRYGTRFILLVGSPNRVASVMPWCTPADQVLVLSELREQALASPVTEDGTYATARARERQYGLTYMRDILMQDRSIAGYFGNFAPNSPFSQKKPPPLSELYREVNWYFDYFERLFDERQIDFVWAQPGGIYNAPIVYVSLHRNLPVTYPINARISTLYSFVSDPFQGSHWIEQAYRRLQDLEVSPIEPESYAFSRKILAESDRLGSFSHLLRETIRHIKIRMHWWLLDLRRWRRGQRLPLTSVLQWNWHAWRCHLWLSKNCEHDIEEVTKRSYALFLLQVEPELTTLSYAKEFNNTAALVQHVAASLPAGMNLVVKEHFANIGNRSIDFYERIKRFPNAVLAHHSIPGITLTKTCDLVCTLNGTVGIEAVQLGRPVVVFSLHSHYDFLPGVTVVRDLTLLPGIIHKVLDSYDASASAAARLAGARYNEAIKSISFDVPNARERGGVGSLADDQAERAVDLLVDNAAWQLQRARARRASHRVPA